MKIFLIILGSCIFIGTSINTIISIINRKKWLRFFLMAIISLLMVILVEPKK